MSGGRGAVVANANGGRGGRLVVVVVGLKAGQNDEKADHDHRRAPHAKPFDDRASQGGDDLLDSHEATPVSADAAVPGIRTPALRSASRTRN